ncbi:MAG: hypothetical protein RR313_02975 [Anaerovoracaceae bacterium]
MKPIVRKRMILVAVILLIIFLIYAPRRVSSVLNLPHVSNISNIKISEYNKKGYEKICDTSSASEIKKLYEKIDNSYCISSLIVDYSFDKVTPSHFEVVFDEKGTEHVLLLDKKYFLGNNDTKGHWAFTNSIYHYLSDIK